MGVWLCRWLVIVQLLILKQEENPVCYIPKNIGVHKFLISFFCACQL